MKNINVSEIERAYRAHNEKRVAEAYCLGSFARILDKNGELWQGSVGHADLGRTREITGKTVFRLASMTKPITAVALMQMAEKGRLSLDTPIHTFLPCYENMQVATRLAGGRVVESKDARFSITPRHLLSHSSGLGSGAAARASGVEKCALLARSVEEYATACLDFHPGTSVQYSPLWAFDVLLRLVELLADMPYDEYMKKYICEPLGMVDTTYAPNDEQVARCVDFVQRTEEGLIPTEIPSRAGFVGFEDGCIGGGAGLFSTPDDYARFARMLLFEGELDGVRILKPESVREMATNGEICTLTGARVQNPFGLGMRVCGEPDGDDQPLPKGSFGWSGAFGCHFWIDIQNGIACTYFMNLSNGGGSDEEASKEFERDVMRGIKT
ncbi:MAG: beta-lactamase family protein [Clostridia bacterium]|nr:beta-lactamase family protein [Clostridia bacterium]